MTKTPHQHGGKRAGSGRKASGKVSKTYRLSPDVISALEARTATSGDSATDIIEKLVRQHLAA